MLILSAFLRYATSAFCRTVWCFGNVASGAYIHGVVMEKRKVSQLHVCACTSTAVITNLKHCTNNKTKQHNTPKAACICCMDILLGYIHVYIYVCVYLFIMMFTNAFSSVIFCRELHVDKGNDKIDINWSVCNTCTCTFEECRRDIHFSDSRCCLHAHRWCSPRRHDAHR